jgi:hypothetical protein
MAYIDNILISLNLPIKNLSLDQGIQALNSLTNNGADVVDKNLLRDLFNRVSADQDLRQAFISLVPDVAQDLAN